MRDLALSQTAQGLSAWLGWPLAALLGPVAGARVLGAAAVLAAASGAALGGRALGGPWSGSMAALLVGAWSLSAGQGWLLGGGTVAWGLAWLGLGLSWDGAHRSRHGLAALGAGLVVLGAAAKPTALAAAPLLLPALLLAERERWRLCLAMAAGALVALLPAWLTLSTSTPWMSPQAVAAVSSSGIVAVFTELAPQGRLPVVLLLGVIGAPLCRRRPAALVALGVVILGAILIADARGERLQPRQLLPLCFGLLVPIAAMAERSRAVLAALVLLAAVDTLSWGHAFADQRSTYLQTDAFPLPRVPWPTYPEPAWVVFHESSTPGALELMALAADVTAGAVALPLTDRRESHLEAAAATLGQPVRILTPGRCCRRGEAVADCAVRVADDHRASRATAIVPGKRFAVPPDQRDFADALILALIPRRDHIRRRWLVVAGQGEGPMACTSR